MPMNPITRRSVLAGAAMAAPLAALGGLDLAHAAEFRRAKAT